MKDVKLTDQIADRLQLLIEMNEMARVAGIPSDQVFSRGQQVRIVSQLLRKADQELYVIPNLINKPEFDTYGGAHVEPPKKGLYTTPIATLDFASLYPSIIIAFNLCYTTLITKDQIKFYKLTPDDYISYNGYFFVKPHIREGVLPKILKEFLKARAHARSEQKKYARGSSMWIIWEGRQLAYKVCANSVYGFAGASKGALPCLAISSTVTSLGQMLIKAAKARVEEKYTKTNGYKCDAKVIYGDTDSIMINMDGYTTDEVLTMGVEMSKYVSELFPPPIEMMFEKVYCPYLLFSKKMYAGNKFEIGKPVVHGDMKGINAVRRGGCHYVRCTQIEMVRILLEEQDVPKTIQYVINRIEELLQGDVGIHELTFSGNYAKHVDKYDSKLPHIELVKKLIAREKSSDSDSTIAPRVGDRISFSYIRRQNIQKTLVKAYDKVETPARMVKDNLQVDYQWIYEHQMINPLWKILEIVINPVDHTKFLDKEEMKKFRKDQLCNTCKGRLTPKEFQTCNNCKDLNHIFYGSHAKSHIGINLQNSGIGLMKYAVKLEKCELCKVSLQKNEKFVCSTCNPSLTEKVKIQHENAQKEGSSCQNSCKKCQRDKVTNLKEKIKIQHEEMTKARNQCQDQCKKCQQEGFNDPNLCDNDECNNFYTRVTTQQKLLILDLKMSKISQM